MTKRDYLTKSEICQVPCPKCGAKAGKMCMQNKGHSHMARLQKAQEILLGAVIRNRVA